ncbi:HAD family phosphatase [Pseudomonadales bacterium]|nr:HAD family phosphatase [Pseudomonadales bacterium]
MTDFSNVTHLLFDHDGVLVDSEYWYFKATQDELAAMDIHLTLGEYMDHMVTGKSAYASQLSTDQREAFRERRNRRYASFLLSQDIQIPGVENTLASLSGSYPMAIVTTSRREHFELIHEARNITSYFDFVLAFGDYAQTKPAPDPYLAAIDRFAIAPENALIIEDSARGLGSAMAAGIRCVMVKNEFTEHQDFTGATAKIDALTDLPELLGKRLPGFHRD